MLGLSKELKERLKDLLLSYSKPVLSKIHYYKDSHLGESAYLMGGGISLKWFDLSEFSRKMTIPCQFVLFHNDFIKLEVEHLLLPEPYFFYPYLKGPGGRLWRNRIQQEYRRCIDDNPYKNFIINYSNYPVLRADNVTYLFRDLCDDRLPDNYITKRIGSFGGSLTYSVIMAVYFGYSHIYLVGFDYTHIPSRSLHWFEKGEGVYYPQYNYHKEFFEIAKEFIDITTITLDGTSEYLRSETYNEHTGKMPHYKENTDIVSGERLRLLATWPDYKIY